MSTTDEIMALADAYALAKYRYAHVPSKVEEPRTALRTAIDALVEQAKWAHHNPKLLSGADAAADLAGVARPGAEPYAYAVYFPDEGREELVHRLDDLLDDLTNCTHGITPLYTAPPQASQPEARPGAEPVAYLYHDAKTPQDAHPWLHSTMLVLAADRRQGLRGETPLYTTPQASQPLTDGELLFHYNTAGGLLSSLRAVQEAILSVNGAAQKGKP